MQSESIKPAAGDSIVDAKQFHPLRGHVVQDIVVRFSVGTMLRLKGTMAGWVLVDAAGQQGCTPQRWADGITAEIAAMEDARVATATL